MPLATYPVELVHTEILSKNTLSVVLCVQEDHFNFRAGQFVSLRFEYEGLPCKRSYSIACSPDFYEKSGNIELALSLIPQGKASEYFCKAKPGEHFTIAGPAGVLTMPDTLPKRLVMVGTGTGITPYRAMIPELERALQSGVLVHIIMGVRFYDDLFYTEDFIKLVQENPGASYDICLSRELSVNTEKNEFKGYVQHRFPNIALNAEEDIIYLCGNPPMIDDSLTWLKEKGFSAKQIRREKYTFSR